MTGYLNKIRISDKSGKMRNKIINTVLVFSLGILLGLFSKWLDNLIINNTIWWQNIIGILDLRKVFSLFSV